MNRSKLLLRILSLVIVSVVAISTFPLNVFSVAAASDGTIISTYSCDFENGVYGSAIDRTKGGKVIADNGNNYLRLSVSSTANNYRFEIYNPDSTPFTVKDGNFYCVTLKYKVVNISGITATEEATTINVGRCDAKTGSFIRMKRFANAFYAPGDKTDWKNASVAFVASVTDSLDSNILAINVTSPGCGTSEIKGSADKTIILFDDVKVYECTGTTNAVLFETNDGDACDPILAQPGEKITLPDATRNCHDFLGWYANAALSKKYTATKMPTADATYVYAKWQISDSAIAVKFNTNGGNSIETVGGNAGDELLLPTPVKSGHCFAGWYSDSKLKNRYTTNAFPTKDTTLYAKWRAIPGFCDFEDPSIALAAHRFSTRCKITTDDKYSGNYSLYYDFNMGDTSHSYALLGSIMIFDEYGQRYNTEKGETYVIELKYKVIEVTVDGCFGVTLSKPENGWSDRTEVLGYNKAVKYTAADVGKGWQTAKVEFTSNYTAKDAGYVSLALGGKSRVYIDQVVIYKKSDGAYDGKSFIAFDTNGGSYVDIMTGTYGAEVAQPAAPVKEGYEFTGWYTDISLTEPMTEWKLSKNYRMLYAGWNKLANDGSLEPGDIATLPSNGSNSKPDSADTELTETDNNSWLSENILYIAVAAAVVVLVAVLVVIFVVVKKKKAKKDLDKETAEE